MRQHLITSILIKSGLRPILSQGKNRLLANEKKKTAENFMKTKIRHRAPSDLKTKKYSFTSKSSKKAEEQDLDIKQKSVGHGCTFFLRSKAIQSLPSSSDDEALQKRTFFVNHLDDMESTASRYAKTIIKELNLKDQQKSIHLATVGGVAGGNKYSENGLFIKLPVDLKVGKDYMYGGSIRRDDLALKAAKNEIRVHKALVNFKLTCAFSFSFSFHSINVSTHSSFANTVSFLGI